MATNHRRLTRKGRVLLALGATVSLTGLTSGIAYATQEGGSIDVSSVTCEGFTASASGFGDSQSYIRFNATSIPFVANYGPTWVDNPTPGEPYTFYISVSDETGTSVATEQVTTGPCDDGPTEPTGPTGSTSTSNTPPAPKVIGFDWNTSEPSCDEPNKLVTVTGNEVDLEHVSFNEWPMVVPPGDTKTFTASADDGFLFDNGETSLSLTVINGFNPAEACAPVTTEQPAPTTVVTPPTPPAPTTPVTTPAGTTTAASPPPATSADNGNNNGNGGGNNSGNGGSGSVDVHVWVGSSSSSGSSDSSDAGSASNGSSSGSGSHESSDSWVEAVAPPCHCGDTDD